MNTYRLIWIITLLTLTTAPFQRPSVSTPLFASYRLGKPVHTPGSYAVIGSDDRFQIKDTHAFPYSAIALIKIHRTGDDTIGDSCTGWMIGPRTIATAAHCIYDHGYPYSVTVHPGINSDDSDTTPFGSCNAINGLVPDGWIKDYNIQYDYGVYQLDCTVGLQTGTFSFKVTSGDWKNKDLQLAGYPGDKPGRVLWSSFGKVTTSTEKGFYYDNDMWPGQSGSPVWDTSDKTCPFCVVAINSSQFGTPARNFGARIDQEAYEFLQHQIDAFQVNEPTRTVNGW